MTAKLQQVWRIVRPWLPAGIFFASLYAIFLVGGAHPLKVEIWLLMAWLLIGYLQVREQR